MQLPQFYKNVSSISLQSLTFTPTDSFDVHFAAPHNNANARFKEGNLVADSTTYAATRLIGLIDKVYMDANTNKVPHVAGTNVVGLRVTPLTGPWLMLAAVNLNAYAAAAGAPDYSGVYDVTGVSGISHYVPAIYLTLKANGGGETLSPINIKRAQPARVPIWLPSTNYKTGTVVSDDAYGNGTYLLYECTVDHYSYIWGIDLTLQWREVPTHNIGGDSVEDMAICTFPPPTYSGASAWTQHHTEFKNAKYDVELGDLHKLTFTFNNSNGQPYHTPRRYVRGKLQFLPFNGTILITAEKTQTRSSNLDNMSGKAALSA